MCFICLESFVLLVLHISKLGIAMFETDEQLFFLVEKVELTAPSILILPS